MKKIAICKTCHREFQYQYYPSAKWTHSRKYCSNKCCISDIDWKNKMRSSVLKNKEHIDNCRERMRLLGKKWGGIKRSKENCINISNGLKKSWDKKGRKLDVYTLIKSSKQYKEWRKAVFERDDYTCQRCGDKTGGNLESHHIIPFIVIYEEYKIGVIKFDGLFDVDNGITLCQKCHKKTENWGYKAKYCLEIRLIKVLRMLWNQNKTGKTFVQYYRDYVNRVIEKLKEQLD